MKNLFLSLGLILSLAACQKSESTSDLGNEPIFGKGYVDAYLTVRNSTPRLSKQSAIHFSTDVSDLVVRIDTADQKQEIEGFGAALTGSSAYLIKQMDPSARELLLNDLFSDKGIGLKYLRICIGSSDFSLGNYTYCDNEGIQNFTIPETDKRDLLPVLKKILEINQNIHIMASPWSAPAWMKSNKHLYGGALAGEDIYPLFSEYLVNFIKSFKSEGIHIDAISLQNEPMHAVNSYPTMYMTSEEQNHIIRDYLGPLLKREALNTKVLIWDHNFDGVDYPIHILDDVATKKFVSGVAFHGYAGSPLALDRLTAAHPDVPIYFTEQSGGGWNTDDPIGNMLYYMKDMLMPSINRGARNFLMWNLALDRSNGPVTTKNGGCQNCRGVVTINGNQYDVNEEYFLLGHFSKFIQSKARRVNYTISGNKPSNVEFSAFINPDGTKVLVALNQSGSKLAFTVRTADRRFTYTLLDQSVVTFIYK